MPRTVRWAAIPVLIAGFAVLLRQPAVLAVDIAQGALFQSEHGEYQPCRFVDNSGPELVMLSTISETRQISQSSLGQQTQQQQTAQQAIQTLQPDSVNQGPAARYGVAIGRCEVSFDEFAEYAKESISNMPPNNRWGRGPRPVINVDRQSTDAYLKWLSLKTGVIYRLPTRSEWRSASRLQADTAGSDAIADSTAENCAECNSPWSGLSTAPVAHNADPKRLFFDLQGNVAEYVLDCGAMDGGSDVIRQLQTQPGIPAECTLGVTGASFDADSPTSSTALTTTAIGFRVARSVVHMRSDIAALKSVEPDQRNAAPIETFIQ